MPIHEFNCRDCETRFETLVMDGEERPACPKCGGESLEKLISAHAVGSRPAEPAPCGDAGCGGGACPAACA